MVEESKHNIMYDDADAAAKWSCIATILALLCVALITGLVAATLLYRPAMQTAICTSHGFHGAEKHDDKWYCVKRLENGSVSFIPIEDVYKEVD